MSSLFELKRITKRYNDIHALDDINLKIEKGEILTVMGPNGSGKTTLLKILAFIDKPTSGEIYFNGETVVDENRSKFRTESTMVFQKTVLFNTTVYKNVAYGLGLRNYSKKEIDEKVRSVLKLVKLDGYEKRPAKRLSGGEQQRVSIARALALDTPLLLLDEPTANLDPKNVSIIEETISQANRDFNTTIVMATHNMFQAENITKKVALLLGGKIAEIGAAQEIFTRPSKNFASFGRLENVFSGASTILEDRTSLINVGEGLKIEAALTKSGRATVFVSPEDIILSKKLIESSARNMFKGRIIEISDLGSIVKIKVDVGRELVTQITKRSFIEMRLNVGSEVFLAFKASSVHVV